MPGNVTVTIGHGDGFGIAIIESALRRMTIWVANCKLAAQAEFPDFMIMKQLNIFDCCRIAKALSLAKQRVRPLQWTQEMKQGLQKNAQVWEIPELELMNQFADWQPRAVSLCLETGTFDNSIGVWAMLLEQMQSSYSTNRMHPSAALEDALENTAVANPTTSGIEGDFGVMRQTYTSQRGCADEETESFCTRLILGLDRNPSVARDKFEEKLAALARHIWAILYAGPRALRTRKRIDKNIPHNCKTKDEISCEATFLKKRRLASVALTDVEKSTLPSNNLPRLLVDDKDVASYPEWDDAHAKEQVFQQQKIKSKKVLAMAENQLLKSEQTDALRKQVVDEHAARLKNQRARERAEQLANYRSSGGLTIAMFDDAVHKQPVFCEIVVSDEVQTFISNNYLVQNTCPSKAMVHIVKNAAAIPTKVQWSAALKGGMILSDKFFKGQVLSYCSALAVHRTIFFSTMVLTHAASLIAFIEQIIDNHDDGASSKWKLNKSGDVAAFRALKSKTSNKTNAKIIGVVMPSEKDAFKDLNHIFSIREFMHKYAVPDFKRCKFFAK